MMDSPLGKPNQANGSNSPLNTITSSTGEPRQSYRRSFNEVLDHLLPRLQEAHESELDELRSRLGGKNHNVLSPLESVPEHSDCDCDDDDDNRLPMPATLPGAAMPSSTFSETRHMESSDAGGCSPKEKSTTSPISDNVPQTDLVDLKMIDAIIQNEDEAEKMTTAQSTKSTRISFMEVGAAEASLYPSEYSRHLPRTNSKESSSAGGKASFIQQHVAEALQKEGDRLMQHMVLAKGLPHELLQRVGHQENHSHAAKMFLHKKPKLARFVEHPLFDVVCALLIFFQGVLIGAKADSAARNPTELLGATPQMQAVELLFSAWFISELSLRFLAVGLIGFLSGPDWSWNIFDTIVVTVNIVEICLYIGDVAASRKDLGMMRMIRILRIMRAVRVIRLIRIFKSLRMMMMSIMRSGMLLIWSMVLLSIIIYMFGIYFMQSVTDHLYENRSNAPVRYEEALREQFGSLGDSFFTLFLSMSSGLDWNEVAKPLISIHWSNQVIMSFFIFFTVFAMLNIITGIFVDTAVNSAKADKDEVIQEEMVQQNANVKKLYNIFKMADENHDGTLTINEFEQLIQRPDIHALFSSMGMEVNEAREMFDLLDHDMTGQITASQFIVGCIRVKGGAKGVDLMMLMQENKKMFRVWNRFFTFVEEEFHRLHEREEQMTFLTEKIEFYMRKANQYQQQNNALSNQKTTLQSENGCNTHHSQRHFGL